MKKCKKLQPVPNWWRLAVALGFVVLTSTYAVQSYRINRLESRLNAVLEIVEAQSVFSGHRATQAVRIAQEARSETQFYGSAMNSVFQNFDLRLRKLERPANAASFRTAYPLHYSKGLTHEVY